MTTAPVTSEPVRAAILVGPTAAGKTDIGHGLAHRLGAGLCSADSMLVYRDMDIGTAKPTPEARRGIPYTGLDCTTPDRTFSVGAYCRAVAPRLRQWRDEQRPILVLGGTGLYVSCLLGGLDAAAGSPPAIRARIESIYSDEGLAGLQAALRKERGPAVDAVRDWQNPRRVMRALARCWSGDTRHARWEGVAFGPVLGLARSREDLYSRIEDRARCMMAAGLLEEASDLRETYPHLSETARQAIGYREAWEVLDGRCTEAAAVERIAVRTRRLAKRQMTWFRNKLDVHWIDIEQSARVDAVTDRVARAWERHGSAILTI